MEVPVLLTAASWPALPAALVRVIVLLFPPPVLEMTAVIPSPLLTHLHC
jgi:hypothetical protein